MHSDCLALLQAPHIQEDAQLTLPLDINNYPFYRYVQIYFRVRCASIISQITVSVTIKNVFNSLGQGGHHCVTVKHFEVEVFVVRIHFAHHFASSVGVGTKVWDVDGTSGVTADPCRGRHERRSSGALHHGGLTFSFLRSYTVK